MCLVNNERGCKYIANKKQPYICSELAFYHPECIPEEFCACENIMIGVDDKEKPDRCVRCGKLNYYEFDHKVTRRKEGKRK